MKFCCLVNTLSGNKKGVHIFQELSNSNSEFIEKIIPLTPSDFNKRLEEAENYKNIIVFGGDGTVSSVLKHFENKENRIGIYPLGTANDLARELGILKLTKRLSLLEILKCYQKSNNIYKLQLWNFQTKERTITFSNYLSFGFEAAVVNQFGSWRNKNKLLTRFGSFSNKLAYGLGILKHFHHRLPENLIIENEFGEIHLPNNLRGIIFSNIKSTAGVCNSNSIGNPADSKIELVMTSSVMSYLKIFSDSYLGTKLNKNVSSAERWNIDCGNQYLELQADGESLGNSNLNKASVVKAGTIDLIIP